MKRKFVFMVAAAVLLAVSSCEEKIQTTTGKVKKLNDSTMVATIDKYDITFDMKQVRFDNGVVIPGAVLHRSLQEEGIVTIPLYGGVVPYALLCGQLADFRHFFQTLEYWALCRPGQSVQCFHVFKYINPTVKIILAFLGTLREIRKLEVYQPQVF